MNERRRSAWCGASQERRRRNRRSEGRQVRASESHVPQHSQCAAGVVGESHAVAAHGDGRIDLQRAVEITSGEIARRGSRQREQANGGDDDRGGSDGPHAARDDATLRASASGSPMRTSCTTSAAEPVRRNAVPWASEPNCSYSSDSATRLPSRALRSCCSRLWRVVTCCGIAGSGKSRVSMPCGR